MTKAAPTDRHGHDGPVRTCIGCRRRSPVAALVRVTRDGGIAVGGPSNGRGAWLCRAGSDGDTVDPACLSAALRRGAFERSWRGPLRPAERRQLERLAVAAGRVDGGPDAP